MPLPDTISEYLRTYSSELGNRILAKFSTFARRRRPAVTHDQQAPSETVPGPGISHHGLGPALAEHVQAQ